MGILGLHKLPQGPDVLQERPGHLCYHGKNEMDGVK